jgi:hypothetical protein
MKVSRGDLICGGNFTTGNLAHIQLRSKSAASGAKARYFRSSTAGLKSLCEDSVAARLLVANRVKEHVG